MFKYNNKEIENYQKFTSPEEFNQSISNKKLKQKYNNNLLNDVLNSFKEELNKKNIYIEFLEWKDSFELYLTDLVDIGKNIIKNENNLKTDEFSYLYFTENTLYKALFEDGVFDICAVILEKDYKIVNQLFIKIFKPILNKKELKYYETQQYEDIYYYRLQLKK